jgi:hypothetical protein
MTSAQAMNALYLQFAPGAEGATRSDEGKCPSEDTWELDNTTAGRVACFYATMEGATAIPETVSRVWTDDQHNIIAFAVSARGDVDAVALRKWWLDQAGPLQNAEDVPGLTPTSAAAIARARTDLLRHIPKNLRSDCATTTRSEERDRLWVRVEFGCQPAAATGVHALGYDAVNPAIVDKVFAATKPPAAAVDGSCPDTGTYTVGKGKAKHTVGEYACATIPETQDGSTVRYTWSNRKLGIIMYAFGTDADQLIKYVASGAGDPIDPTAKAKSGS